LKITLKKQVHKLINRIKLCYHNLDFVTFIYWQFNNQHKRY